MKSILTILLLTASLFVSGQTIKGRVVNGETNQGVSYANVQLIDHFTQKNIDFTECDIYGNFKFGKQNVLFVDLKVPNLRYSDTCFQNLFVNADTTLTLVVYERCEYDISKNDKTCPVCHKKDQTIPIVYGLLVPPTGKHGQVKKEDEEAFMKKFDVEFHSGGCVVSGCDPHWYCRRDKTEF